MPKSACVTIYLEINDEAEFRAAARDRALVDGVGEEDAAEYLCEEQKTLGNCAQMLFDPGESPPGCSILDSCGE